MCSLTVGPATAARLFSSFRIKGSQRSGEALPSGMRAWGLVSWPLAAPERCPSTGEAGSPASRAGAVGNFGPAGETSG